MKTIEVGSKKGKTRHFIDVDKYSFLSKGKALCGKLGKELVNYDAVFFNYKIVYPNMCKKCLKLNEK